MSGNNGLIIASSLCTLVTCPQKEYHERKSHRVSFTGSTSRQTSVKEVDTDLAVIHDHVFEPESGI